MVHPASVIYIRTCTWTSICFCQYSSEYIYLLQQFGGFGLFDFTVKAHRLLSIGHFEMEEWHKMVKLIFGQIIEGVEYMHKRGVCHFDLSLENMLISDVDVVKNKQTGKLSFRHETVQCVIVDCGLAEMFDDRNADYQSNKHCGRCIYYCVFMYHIGHTYKQEN